jgi:hypothetical protein
VRCHVRERVQAGMHESSAGNAHLKALDMNN